MVQLCTLKRTDQTRKKNNKKKKKKKKKRGRTLARPICVIFCRNQAVGACCIGAAVIERGDGRCIALDQQRVVSGSVVWCDAKCGVRKKEKKAVSEHGCLDVVVSMGVRKCVHPCVRACVRGGRVIYTALNSVQHGSRVNGGGSTYGCEASYTLWATWHRPSVLYSLLTYPICCGRPSAHSLQHHNDDIETSGIKIISDQWTGLVPPDDEAKRDEREATRNVCSGRTSFVGQSKMAKGRSMYVSLDGPTLPYLDCLQPKTIHPLYHSNLHYDPVRHTCSLLLGCRWRRPPPSPLATHHRLVGTCFGPVPMRAPPSRLPPCAYPR
jgi:hypothetical protein